MKGRVLIIAGSDSGGGAGIQADIKSVTALGGFAMTAITALTAQNTIGVQSIYEIPANFVREQMISVLDDIGVDAIKVGMLHRSEIIETVVDVLAEKAKMIPLVLDPVMVAKGGAGLIEKEAIIALKNNLLPKATLLTPNAPEAEILSGTKVQTVADSLTSAAIMLNKGAKNILMKGGHSEGDELIDILVHGDGEPNYFKGPRIKTRNTHGTGCTLASACAVGLAQGLNLKKAVYRAHTYVRSAIQEAPGYGSGHGPLNHAHTLEKI